MEGKCYFVEEDKDFAEGMNRRETELGSGVKGLDFERVKAD